MFYKDLEEKAKWVRRETLLIHKRAPSARIASSLSCVEIITALFYGGILRFKESEPLWPERDRLIVSKGHGSLAMYPVLSDLGFLPHSELERVCQDGAMLGSIPDCKIPGYETINGSLGHGLGVACGVSLSLLEQNRRRLVYCLQGDGELYEGSVWEAIQFAGYHGLHNLTLIIDGNRKSMMGFCDHLYDGLPERFRSLGWEYSSIPNDMREIFYGLVDNKFKRTIPGKPKVLFVRTTKGAGVPELEGDPMCHIRSLTPDRIDEIIEDMN